MKSIRFAFFASLCVSMASPLAGCVDGEEPVDIAEPADEADLLESQKADAPTLALTVLDVGRPLNAEAEKVGLIKSKARYREIFGVNPPSSVNFSRQWVAYYTAGVQRSGGFTASIKQVRLSNSGKTIFITGHLAKPGDDCIVTLALTNPYAVVAFPKPSTAPAYTRYIKASEFYSCGPECSSEDTVSSYRPSTDGKACKDTETYCVTTNNDACPQIRPPGPNFCQGGTVDIEMSYVDSADGDGTKCKLPVYHCLTGNSFACPQILPPPPSFCSDGTRESGSTYVAATDGRECKLPTFQCVTRNPNACQ